MAITQTSIAARPEYVNEVEDVTNRVIVDKRLGTWELLWDNSLLRRAVIILAICITWQAYAAYLDNPLLVPLLTSVVEAFYDGIVSGELVARTAVTLQVLLISYGIGIVLAGIITAFAATTRIGDDILSTLTSMFNPLPAIALLPLALMWFGLGVGSLIFVVVHSVLWAVALNMHTGFKSISPTQKMAAQNYGLSGLKLVAMILLPAGFPSILTGLKIGWAFAWRTMVAAELVFGVSAGSGGLGWYIFEYRNQLETDKVFAGLITVIIIGVVVERLIFTTIENRTIRRWGMVQA